MIHLYCGDGKGKTTAAMGLVLRSVGRNRRAVVAQFLKSSNSGERFALAQLPNVTLLAVPERVKFSFQMNEDDRKEAAQRFAALCTQCEAALQDGVELVVLDEACAAVNTGLLPLETLLHLLDTAPEGAEVVITGRNPPPELVERGDYITEMKKIRHPYEKGVCAREGIEF
jgi:cob(I)alamin adenosyltransferase